MSHATPTDLRDLGMPAAACRELTDAQLQRFLDGATGQAESYLRGRYLLPGVGDFVPPELRRVCVAIASYDLLSWRGYDMREEGGDGTFLKRYEQAIEWLKMVRDGELTIALPLAPTGTATSGAGFIATREPRGWGA